MSFEVIVTEPFERKFKQLSKKYPSLPRDLVVLVEELTKYPQTGIPLGKDLSLIHISEPTRPY